MKQPKIIESVFEECDIASNSIVLRLIFANTRVGELPGIEPTVWLSELESWGVRIEDKHDNETEFHYVLEVGLEDYRQNCRQYVYSVKYIDYRSEIMNDGMGHQSSIAIAPGEYKIYIYLPEGAKCVEEFADSINKAYYGAMVKTLPEYAILTDRMQSAVS